MSGVARQQLPEGYKQTVVGVIPDDWNIISIDHALTKKMILDQMDGNHGELYPKSHEFSDSGVPYVGANDFDGGMINFKSCKYIPEKRAALFKKGVAKNGDVLFAHNATVGPVAMVETDLDYIILSTTATYYRCDNKTLRNAYLKAYFESGYFVGQYTAVMSQSTRNQVPILAQRKFIIVLPSEEEQAAIANALSNVDVLITSLEKLIAKKRAIKTAAMQQLLTGKKRLPPFDKTHTSYKQTELGEIPEDWEVIDIGSITSKVGSGKTPKGGSTVYRSHGRPLVRSQNVGWGDLKLDDVAYISEEVHETFLGSELCEKDVLLNITGASIGRCTTASKELAGGNVNQHVCIIRVNSEEIDSRIIARLILSGKGQRQIDSFQAGGNREGLNFTQVKALQFAIPESKEEQSLIANILCDMDENIEKLEQRLTKTQQLKQGMMQELLTGRTRLI